MTFHASLVMFDPGNFLPYYLRNLCGALHECGFRALVIASPPMFDEVATDDLYDVERLFFPSLRGLRRRAIRKRHFTRKALKVSAYPLGLARTWRRLRRESPGIFHAQWAPLPFLDAMLFRALKSLRWRIVYTAHDAPPDQFLQKFAWRHHRQMLRSADAVIVHTPEQAERMTAAFPAISDRLHVVAHGGIVYPFPGIEERQSHRDDLGIGVDRQVLLFFGMIKQYKGLEYLLDSMKKVIERFPRALLVIAGEPLISMRPFFQQIERLGLNNHVLLRLGFVPDNEVSAYLRSADMLVTPYTNIGASGVVVLAQGHGLPVVVTRVGGLPGFVEPEQSGFVVAPRDSSALAEAISRGLADPAELREMGRRGWMRLARDNRWPDVARKTLDVYDTLQDQADSTATA